jgi:hypothetical protein
LKRENRLPVVITVLVTAVLALAGCGTPHQTDQKTGRPAAALSIPFSLAALPASGYIDLEPVDAAALQRLGLGGPSPVSNPPYYPFNRYGMYWSEPFYLAEGDTLKVTVSADTPVSWFGVDWSDLNIRGIVADMELDEDGRTFDPQYPASFSADGRGLTVNYKSVKDTECVLVVKNASPDRSWRISVNVTAKSVFSIKRFLKEVPVVQNLFQSDDDIEY